MGIVNTLRYWTIFIRLHPRLDRIYNINLQPPSPNPKEIYNMSIKIKKRAYPTVVLAKEARLADTAVLYLTAKSCQWNPPPCKEFAAVIVPPDEDDVDPPPDVSLIFCLSLKTRGTLLSSAMEEESIRSDCAWEWEAAEICVARDDGGGCVGRKGQMGMDGDHSVDPF